jgi:hypothetical protein
MRSPPRRLDQPGQQRVDGPGESPSVLKRVTTSASRFTAVGGSLAVRKLSAGGPKFSG